MSTGVPKHSTGFLLLSLFTVVLHGVTAAAQYLVANGSAAYTDLALYYIAAVALIACYAAVVQSVRENATRRVWLLVVGVPLIVQIGWLLLPPVLAIDAYSYLVDAAHAYSGLNPY